jgi:hypothetical protein
VRKTPPPLPAEPWRGEGEGAGEAHATEESV